MMNKKITSLLLTAILLANSSSNLAFASAGSEPLSEAIGADQTDSIAVSDTESTPQAEKSPENITEPTVPESLDEDILVDETPAEDELSTEDTPAQPSSDNETDLDSSDTKDPSQELMQEQTAEEQTIQEESVQEKRAIVLNEKNFPDTNFRSIISILTGVEEGRLLDASALDNVTEIIADGKGIKNTKGLEYFTKLEKLNLRNNKLSSIDIKRNWYLKELDLSGNQLTSIDLIDHGKLITLNLSHNALTSVDLEDTRNLLFLDLSHNQLDSISVATTTELKELHLNNNHLKELNAEPLFHVETMDLSSNQLASVWLNNPSLLHLNLSNNQLRGLNLNASTILETLNLSANRLLSVDLRSNTRLRELDLSKNELSRVELDNHPMLVHAQINNQVITADVQNKIHVSNTGIFTLDMDQILDISGTASSVYSVNNYAVQGSIVTFGKQVPEQIQVQLKNGPITASFTISLVHAQDQTIQVSEQFFPDENFRQVVCSTIGVQEGALISQDQLNSVTEIVAPSRKIQSIKGIEYFKKLKTLNLAGNKINQVDLRANTQLEDLYLYSNQITSIDLTGNKKLHHLYIFNNRLQNLDLSQNNELVKVTAQNNQLASMDLKNNPLLENVSFDNNLIADIDLSNSTKLTALYLDGNLLESINIQNSPLLKTLNVSNNKLSELDLHNNGSLSAVYANGNNLKTLDVTANASLTELSVNKNDISELDLHQNINLTHLYAKGNHIASLDLSANKNLRSINLENQTFTVDVTDLIKHNISGYSLELQQILKFTNEKGFVLNGFKGTSYGAEEYNFVNSEVGFKEEVPSVFLLEAHFSGDYDTSSLASFTIKLEYNKNDRIKLSAKYFPDSQFRKLLIHELNKPENSLLTQKDLESVTILNCDGFEVSGIHNIHNIKGIEYFTNLQELMLPDNKIQSADLRKNTKLTTIYLDGNQLMQLDVSSNRLLEILSVGYNQLEALDFTGNPNLKYVVAENNRLKSINLLHNEQLEDLTISQNQLSEIDLTHNPMLQSVMLHENLLKAVDFSHNPELEYVTVSNNNLTSLDFSKNEKLNEFDASNNCLTNLTFPKIFTGAMSAVDQSVVISASDSILFKDGKYLLDLNTVFHINSTANEFPIEIQEFIVVDYPITDGVVDLGGTLPETLDITVTLTNNNQITAKASFVGNPSIEWTPIGPSTPIVPDGSIDWTPIGPSTPIVPDGSIDWTPIGPSTPIVPDSSIDWTPIGPSTPVTPNQGSGSILPKPQPAAPQTNHPIVPTHRPSGNHTLTKNNAVIAPEKSRDNSLSKSSASAASSSEKAPVSSFDTSSSESKKSSSEKASKSVQNDVEQSSRLGSLVAVIITLLTALCVGVGVYIYKKKNKNEK